MASFNESGLDDLQLSLEELADIPSEVLLDMLEAGGEVIKKAQEQKLLSLKFKDKSTGQLAKSLRATKKLKRDYRGVPGISIYPGGIRKGEKATNGEVGFILEYGAPGRGIAPRSWMRTASEEAADEAVDAEAKVYGEWVDSVIT